MHFLSTIAACMRQLLPDLVVAGMSRCLFAGETLEDAVRCVRLLNAEGFSATLDYLGDAPLRGDEARTMAEPYMDLIDAIERNNLDAEAAIKVSGLGATEKECRSIERVESIIAWAGRGNVVVRIDMEDVRLAHGRLDATEQWPGKYRNVSFALRAGVPHTYSVLASFARQRSAAGINNVMHQETPVRLVAGTVGSRDELSSYFLHHVERCFEADLFVTIATHDENLIDQVVARSLRRGVERGRFEFQVALGMREEVRGRLRQMGFRVRVYVPFGKNRNGYSNRILNEHPDAIWRGIGSLFLNPARVEHNRRSVRQ
ncbi:proline dehydrogenase family protein [Burkholderia cepacia]|uniref:proline dehydrogenase family protein n=1 Tax=Burkholderia cepacia TaxID=292 RepID=UPI001866D258|nr:proline dehydrogenase family protein [Burkholderia cepacia]MBE2966687.1 proline dehydrogenase family protein [Burkholderia cepacia]